MGESFENLCDHFATLYTGIVADALDRLGYMNQTLPNDITPLRYGMGFAGIAHTAWGEPDPDASYEPNIRRFLHMLGDAPEHGVLLVEANDSTSAQLGELSTAALTAQRCRGAVINGGVRDTEFIVEQEFPVFSAYETPADSPPRWRLDDWDVEIEVGDVTIEPGDVIVADGDGVVSVPRDVASTVLEEASEKATQENAVREAVTRGVSPIDAFDEHGTF